MGPFFGVILHSIGGFAAGSFYIPFKKVQRWAWESYWLIQGVAAWVIMPWVGAWLTTPDPIGVLSASPTRAIALAYLFGALWGIGGLTFGLSMRYLGMSLGYAISLGFCATFGTLVPPLWGPLMKGELLQKLGEPVVYGQISSLLVCLAGIGVCGYAGILKERQLTEEEKRSTIKEFNLVKGYAVAVFAGVMSACMSFAMAAGEPIAKISADTIKAAHGSAIFQNNPVLIPIMAGGFTTNFLWCIGLNLRNRTVRDYVTPGPGQMRNYLFASLAGIIWYLQFFFYGMGSTKMGSFSFSSWTIHMAFIIVFSNLWGLFFHEWKGVSAKTRRLVWLGINILVLSTIIAGWVNYVQSLPKP